MKTVLIPWYLNQSDNDDKDRIIPLGLMSISSYLKKHGYHSIVKDLNLFSNKSIDELAEILLQTEGEIYGFSVAAGTLHTALQLSRRIKEVAPEKIIVFGGPQATLTAEKLMSCFEYIDMVIRGEGEITFLRLLEALKTNDLYSVDGLTWREKQKIITNRERELMIDLDTLEFPDHSTYSVSELNHLSMPIEVGRGCPFTCAFCSSSILWKRKYRVKSIQRIILEIKYIIENLQIRMFYFRHDQLILNRDWIILLCEEICRLGTPITWQCSARIDTVDKELLTLMKESGCIGIEFGIESLSENIQDKVDKRLKKDLIIKNLNMVIQCGINPVLFFMCGFPDESYRDLMETLDGILRILMSCEVYTFFQLRSLQPFPSTKLRENNKERLVFYPERLPEDILSTYTIEQIECAKQYSDLFPEFYYIENKHQIKFDYFLQIEKIYNSIIRFMNTHFFLVFKYILYKNECNYNKLFELFKGKMDLDKMDFIKKEGLVHILYELTKKDFSWVQDVFQYEKCIYDIQSNYQKIIKKSNINSQSILSISPNLKILEFNIDMPHVFQLIKKNTFNKINTEVLHKKTNLLILAVNELNVSSLKLNGDAVDFIKQFDGKRKLEEICKTDQIKGNAIMLLEKGVLV